VRGHLRRPDVPDGLRRKIAASLASAPPIQRHRIWHEYPRAVPAAAAAVALFAILGSARQGNRRAPVLLQQAVRTYHSSLPMDVVASSCDQVARWFRGKVDFNVASPHLGDVAACLGGRVINVQDRFGAYFLLDAPGGHRVGMMVFNAGDEDDLGGPIRRTVGGHEVYFGTAHGASTAAFRERDLAYVMTSDLGEDALSNMIETAWHEPQQAQ